MSSSGRGNEDGGGASSSDRAPAQSSVVTMVSPSSNGLFTPLEIMDNGPNAHLHTYRLEQGPDGLMRTTRTGPPPNFEEQKRAQRIAELRRDLDANTLPDQRVNFEALIRYYEGGGRQPAGTEELWVLDGEFVWGRLRRPEDFPLGVYFNPNVKKFCENTWMRQ
ncbi:hypothetical protein B0T26DRAFT_681859 [Lasiosphaeria miniovina]|uniref:Uncharacterized protein n=1 Tax=Lasiosphaeria miniovina TaxID=1954250 RepID=A0AA39ZQU7_9PEZI|nr:uncharacterized protein B0T26DRAFT_681859 [Lasiosphaeria miniovina]KAK0701745.1 hypothetical protein B0T26DRAFT_681859 [Lasiosphaeria miniovina]